MPTRIIDATTRWQATTLLAGRLRGGRSSVTRPVDPYSRLYWRLIDDEKFVDIYLNDHHFAMWARLLLTADMAWPSSAALPYGSRKASLQKLSDVGLVDLLPGNRYRIHGLDAERGTRQQKASNAAGYRHGTPGGANGTGEQPVSTPSGVPRLDETRQDEPRRDSGVLPRIGVRERARLEEGADL